MIADKILLLVCDSLRLDHWDQEFAQHFGPSSPDWFTVSHCSDPNFAAIYSGQPPWRNGVVLQVGKHHKLERTLAMEAKDAGLATMTLKVHKSAEFYSRGFDEVFMTTCKLSTGHILESITSWLRHTDRYFAAIRIMETHSPYTGGHRQLPLRERYAAGVRSAAEVCKTLADAAEGAFVVITADHGEELNTHGAVGHVYGLHDNLLRVPFWCSDMARIDFPGPHQHPNIWSLLMGLRTRATGWPLAFCGLASEDAKLWWYAAVRTERLKLIQKTNCVNTESFSVFDLQQDPGEEDNLATLLPQKPDSVDVNLTSAKIFRRLRKLGYV